MSWYTVLIIQDIVIKDQVLGLDPCYNTFTLYHITTKLLLPLFTQVVSFRV